MRKLICKIKFEQVKYYIYLSLVVMWMILVFSFSAQVSVESDNTSSHIVDFAVIIINKTGYILNQQHIDVITFIVRKLAHFSLYALGGFLIVNYISVTKIKKYFLYSVIIGISYATTDEIHQLFVEGRSCELRDVIIDSLGILFGCSLFYIMNRIIMKCVNKRGNLIGK